MSTLRMKIRRGQVTWRRELLWVVTCPCCPNYRALFRPFGWGEALDVAVEHANRRHPWGDA